MTTQKVHLAYFSATGTTARVVSAIESGLGLDEKSNNNLIVINSQETVIVPSNELVIFGIPVFSGRVPEIAKQALEKIKGDNTPAIITCVYGNRDFDDALLELKEIVEANGFYVLSAGAFIAQHSIFPKVAQGRPDSADLKAAEAFGRNSIKALTATTNTPLTVKGNHPYRATKPIPLNPKTDSKCNSCGLCAKQCPTQAIDLENPKRTDKSKCISCAHCIAICPKHSKRFGGLLYWLASRSFQKNYSQRKEPYLIYR